MKSAERIGKSKDQLGFTLIETMIAMMIMAGAIMILATSWSGNVARVKSARLNNTMAALLERKMTETEILYKDKPLNEIVEEDSGDFGDKYPEFRWEMTSKEFEMPNLSSALISQEGGADEMLLTIVRTMSEHISQTVKEVNVAVIYKSRAGREIKSSVTTYFIDYAKPLPLPGLPGGANGNNPNPNPPGGNQQ